MDWVHLNDIRDALLAALESHRANCIDPNCKEPMNTLGWLAHCLGIRKDRYAEFRDAIGLYEDNCPGCTHLSVIRKGEFPGQHLRGSK